MVVFTFSGIDFFRWFDFCWLQVKNCPRSQFDWDDWVWFPFLFHGL